MKAAHTMVDQRESMRAAQSDKAARSIVTTAQNRLAQAKLVHWPALEQSLQQELDDVLAIARQRGFAV